MAKTIVKAATVERITRKDGRPFPPSGHHPSPNPDWGGLPTDGVYTCPKCQKTHELDLDAMGKAVWSQTLPDKTKYPDLDRIAQGHDIKCWCGLVARFVGSIGEWGKMGPYYYGIDYILERA